MPTFFLSSVAKRIEKLQRDFLWSGIGEEHKFHLVNWTQICKPVQNGGLGIINSWLNEHTLIRWIFMWSNNHKYISMSRLDRFFITPD